MPFFGGGSPAKIDYRKKGTLILTSLLVDLEQADLLRSALSHGRSFKDCFGPGIAFPLNQLILAGSGFNRNQENAL